MSFRSTVGLFLIFAVMLLPFQVSTTHASETHRNLAYASISPANTLDLYLPDGEGPFPLVIWIHGGGWQRGDKAQTPARFLVNEGFAVASVNYRLSDEAPFPAQIYDVKAAVRWLRANAATYQLDPNRFGAWGSSAGGHLAVLLGTSGDVTELEDLSMGNADFSSRVEAVVDWFGPTDFVQMATTSGYERHASANSPGSRLLDCPILDCPEIAATANPVTYVSPDDPPFFIQHGTDDPVVPFAQSQILYDALQNLAVPIPATLEFLEGAGHGGREFRNPENLASIQQFLEQYLQ